MFLKGSSCRSMMRKPYTEFDLRRLAGVTLPPINSTATIDDEDNSPSSVIVGTTSASERSAQLLFNPTGHPKAKSTPCAMQSTPSPASSETLRRRASSLAVDYGTLPATSTVCRGVPTLAGVEVVVEKRPSQLDRATTWIRRRFGLDRWQWPPRNTVLVAEAIDSFSRFAFPFTFLILSLVYWTVYLHIRPTVVREQNFVTVDED